jgi:hypothetical protein
MLPSILDGRKEQHILMKLNAEEKGVSFMLIEKLRPGSDVAPIMLS